MLYVKVFYVLNAGISMIRKCILIFQRVKIDLLFTWFIGSRESEKK